MKKLYFVLPFALLVAGCKTNNLANGNVKTKSNIIYIIVDYMGYGNLGCYGQKEIKTPAIYKIASDGMRFTQHYSGRPDCAPSGCVLMTGLQMGNSKIRGNSTKV